MATTPLSVNTSRKIDDIIDDLNARWDLSLPKLHGPNAGHTDSESTARKCSRRIQYLCYKTDNIHKVIKSFEEQARPIQSQWVFKPSQERGTLPVLPQTKSLVDRDFQLRRKNGIVRLNNEQRSQLQALLYKTLNEEYELATMSDSYSTEQASTAGDRASTSTRSFTTAPSTPRKQMISREQEIIKTPSRRIIQASETIITESDEPQLKDPTTNSTKRSLESPSGVSIITLVDLTRAYLRFTAKQETTPTTDAMELRDQGRVLCTPFSRCTTTP